MTEVEALEVISDTLERAEILCIAGDMTVTETEYEPPYAGIWVTMADGSRWVVRVESAVSDKENV